MTDIHQVFARFRDDPPAPSPNRKVLNIRRRGSAHGTRAVEVVHIKSGRPASEERPNRPSTVRAAVWSDGFPTKPAIASPLEALQAPAVVEPTAHVMPAWQPSEASSTTRSDEAAQPPRPRDRPRKLAPPNAMDSADPFDAEDDGANCLRCGYRIEDTRAGRGLLTCAGCG